MALLNVKKLEDSGFLDEFLGFAERYDELYNNDLMISALTWVSNKNSYDMIRFFLAPNSFESVIPFTAQDFISMNVHTLACWQERITDICAMLDEKKVLYLRLLSFYE